MSNKTIADIKKISSKDLANRILAKEPGLAIIDVRDSDYIGGHINGCTNVPTNTLDYRLPELIRTLQDKDTVVFHCALSQQRGPQSALRYLREKDRQTDGESKQKILILEGGFTKWQEQYGEDERLTEGYRKDIWQDGF